MLKRQENAIRQVIRLRAGIDEAYRRVDVGVYNAVRVQGVPVRVLAEQLGLTRSRVYQMIRNHEQRMDIEWENAQLDKSDLNHG